MVTFHNPSSVAAPVGKYSHVVVIDLGSAQMLMTAGQVALNPQGELVGKGDMAAQTEQVYKNLQAILEAHGAKLSDIVKANIYITDMQAIGQLAGVRNRFMGDHAPISTLVEVSKLAMPDLLVEIEVTAVIVK